MPHPSIRAVLVRLRHKAHEIGHVVCHKGEHLFHSAYLGIVSVEAHGFYRYAAGVTLFFIVADFLLSFAKEA
jgi:hypothetical protein